MKNKQKNINQLNLHKFYICQIKKATLNKQNKFFKIYLKIIKCKKYNYQDLGIFLRIR